MEYYKIIEAPELNHDAMMLNLYGKKVSRNGHLERKIVANLLNYLEQNGFKTVALYDGEELTKTRSWKAAMELIFNLDESSVRVQKEGCSEHGILLILGEGDDIICDWSFSNGDADGFDKIMSAFDVEKIR